MKKRLLLVFAVVLVLSCLVLAACQPNCNNGHTWGEWVETQPTCTAKGSRTRTCSVCGETDTQEFGEPTGHVVTDSDGQQLSCSGVDFEAGVACSACGETLTGQQLSALLKHGSTRVVTEKYPTCTEAGNTKGHSCRTCGMVTDGVEPIEPLGHESVVIEAKAATCTEPGYSAGEKCSRCGVTLVQPEESEPALGHDFDESKLNYVTCTPCSRNCGAYKVLHSENIYIDQFVYTFDETKQTEINTQYQYLKDLLAGLDQPLTGEQFDEEFLKYDEFIVYVQFQYQVAQVLNDLEYTAQTRDNFSTISEYYYASIEKYYGLFKEIYASETYSEYFFKDWTQEEIDEVLALADSYDAENRTEADRITDEYETLLGQMSSGIGDATDAQKLQLFDLYSQLVTANNNIATTAGYNNYMEYAYKVVYERDYTPEQTAEMRQLVKQYIGPVTAQVANDYMAWMTAYQNRGGWTSTENQLYYSQYVGDWFLRDVDNYTTDADRSGMIANSRQDVSDYFVFLSQAIAEERTSFSDALVSLFRDGNYFLGTNPNRTAYSWYVYELELPIMVFTDDYKSAFTFTHEFGHHFQRVYNGQLGVAMDLDETQSQGNEMLFLAYLRAHMPEGMEEGFEILELEQLINMLGSVVLSTAVDEFEYVVYTGAAEYDGAALPTLQKEDGTNVINYSALYETILESYWAEVGSFFNTEYWGYVVFDQAGYYISYAMSALPSLQLYAKAGVDGLEATRDSYVKLFTFADEAQFVAVETGENSDGTTYEDRYIKDGVTYQNILNWAGLYGPFEENLYTTIQQFFSAN